jgi:outer membrane protein assembly factor BamB
MLRSRFPRLGWAILVSLFGSGAPASLHADDWPQWLGPQRDGVWRETGILEKFPPEGPRVLWRTAIGSGFAGPAVVGEHVYVMDRQGATLPKGAEAPPRNGGLAGSERIVCLHAPTGKLHWKHEYECPYTINYPSGPRTTPVVHQGKVYTLGSMGDLYCLDAATGKVQWSRHFVKDFNVKPPLWGWSASLLLEGDKVFALVGGEGSAVVAFHKDTGKEIWRALTVEEVGYAPPMLFEAAGKRQLLIWHTEAVNALDPQTGTLYWSIPYPEVPPVRPGITVSTPQKAGELLFFTSVHHGPLMLQLAADKPGARVLWKGKSNNVAKPDGLHCLMSSPVLQDGHIYGVCAFGELRCLKADTGERLWETYAATTGKKALFGNAFLVLQGKRFFIFNEKGDLILAKLTPQGYEELDRAHVLEPTLTSRGRDVVWSHPAFAQRCVYLRNDKEIICLSLAAG